MIPSPQFPAYATLLLAAILPLRAPADVPAYIGNVGPMHGSWAMNGKPVAGSEAVPPGATFTVIGKHVARGTPRSITIYLLDGRLVTKSCLDDASCAGRFTIPDTTSTDVANADMETGVRALQKYRFTYATPASRAAFDSTPADGVVAERADGTLELGPLFGSVTPGTYRIEFRPLDPANHFNAGDPVDKTFSWTGDAGLLAASLPPGLYSAQLFSSEGIGRELGSPAWIAIIGDRADVASAAYARTRTLTASWKNPEATQTFLRAYLTSIASER